MYKVLSQATQAKRNVSTSLAARQTANQKVRTTRYVNMTKRGLQAVQNAQVAKPALKDAAPPVPSIHPLETMTESEILAAKALVDTWVATNSTPVANDPVPAPYLTYDYMAAIDPPPELVYAFERTGGVNSPPRKFEVRGFIRGGSLNLKVYQFIIQGADSNGSPASILQAIQRGATDRTTWDVNQLFFLLPEAYGGSNLLFSDQRVRAALKRRTKMDANNQPAGNIIDADIDEGRIWVNFLLDGRLSSNGIPGNKGQDKHRPVYMDMPDYSLSQYRLYWLIFLYNDTVSGGPSINSFKQPIEGLVVFYDAATQTIIDVNDAMDPVRYAPGNCTVPVITGKINPFPLVDTPGAVAPELTFQPITITQPKPSFGPVHYDQADGAWKLDSSFVQWGPYEFRLQFNGRSGLSIRRLDVKNPTRNFAKESLIYEHCIDEIITAYADPQIRQANAQYLDWAEYNYKALTFNFNDVLCPPNTVYGSFTTHGPDGSPLKIDKAVALYESIDGELFYHFDFFGGLDPTPDYSRPDALVQGVPNRQLNVVFQVTVGNYDYIFKYILRLDGQIQTEIHLTGMMSFKGVTAADAHSLDEKWDGRFGTLVDPYLLAPNHQHWMEVKTTWDLVRDQATDLPAKNIVNRAWIESLNLGPDNAFGNAWVEKEQQILWENDSPDITDEKSARHWTIENPTAHSYIHNHRGYAIVPVTGNPKKMMNPKSRFAGRTTFADYNFVATVHNPAEKWALGDWPVEKDTDVGLSQYLTMPNQSLDGAMITTRYTMTFGHKPHVEDFPLMPREEVKVLYKPHNFFEQNPSMRADRAVPTGGFTLTQ